MHSNREILLQPIIVINVIIIFVHLYYLCYPLNICAVCSQIEVIWKIICQLLVYMYVNKKDGYRQQNVRQRQKLISIIDYDVCMTFY